MKNLTFLSHLTFLLFFSFTIAGQTPNWQWATSGTGTGTEGSNKVISDNNGNSVVGGLYEGSMTLDGTTVSVHANNAGLPFDLKDFYMAKYNATGNLAWIVYPTAVDTCFASRISDFVADQAGNIYAFFYYSPFNVNSGLIFGTDTIRENGGLIKFDPSGNVIWYSGIDAKSGTSHYGSKISVDDQGNVYLIQNFSSNEASRIYDTVTVSNQNPTSGTELILVKYNSSGSALWGKTFGGNSYDDPLGVQVVNNSDVYIFGSFNSDTLFFDATNYVISTAGGGFADPDYFYSKLDANGNIIWAKSIAYGSAGVSNAYFQIKAVVNNAGEIFLADQNLNSTLDIGSITLNSPGFFIAKTDANGVPLWATVVGDSLVEAPNDIQLDGSGNIYVIGSFVYDSIQMANTTFYNTAPGSFTYDFYVAIFDSNGLPIGAFSGGGDDSEYAMFAVNSNSSMFLSGSFSSNSLTFDSTILSNPNFPSNHMFLTYSTPILSGLNDPDFSENFSIYPNPATAEINLQIKNIAAAPSTISILNSLGEIVYSKAISNELNSTIDVSRLPSGVYVLQVQDQKNVSSGKFIKY